MPVGCCTATGIAGRMAVRIAQHFGATKFIVTGRNAAQLDALKAALAEHEVVVVNIGDGDAASLDAQLGVAFQRVGVPAVVLDYLWGQSAERIISVVSSMPAPVGGK